MVVSKDRALSSNPSNAPSKKKKSVREKGGLSNKKCWEMQKKKAAANLTPYTDVHLKCTKELSSKLKQRNS